MERDGVYRLGSAAAVVLVAAAGGLLVWLALGAARAPAGAESAEAPGRLAAPASPGVPEPAAHVKPPAPTAKPIELKLATPGKDILLTYGECPAKCLVALLEEARPSAAIGAWCRQEGPDLYVCLSVVDDPAAGLYGCHSWFLRTDRRVGIEVLRRGEANCPPRPMTPPFGGEAR